MCDRKEKKKTNLCLGVQVQRSILRHGHGESECVWTKEGKRGETGKRNQRDTQTNRQTGRQPVRQTDRQTNKETADLLYQHASTHCKRFITVLTGLRLV